MKELVAGFARIQPDLGIATTEFLRIQLRRAGDRLRPIETTEKS